MSDSFTNLILSTNFIDDSHKNFQKMKTFFEKYGYELVRGNPSHPTFTEGYSVLKGRYSISSELDWFVDVRREARKLARNGILPQ